MQKLRLADPGPCAVLLTKTDFYDTTGRSVQFIEMSAMYNTGCVYPLQRARWNSSAWHIRVPNTRALIALLLLLTIALSEPILCVIHCQLWLPIAYHSYFAAQHQHTHAAHAAEAPLSTARPVANPAAIQPMPGICFFARGMQNSEGQPFHVPPSPIHDMLAVRYEFLVSPVIQRALICPPTAPAPARAARLLRPPAAIPQGSHS